jgi:hypothetical protein
MTSDRRRPVAAAGASINSDAIVHGDRRPVANGGQSDRGAPGGDVANPRCSVDSRAESIRLDQSPANHGMNACGLSGEKMRLNDAEVAKFRKRTQR